MSSYRVGIQRWLEKSRDVSANRRKFRQVAQPEPLPERRPLRQLCGVLQKLAGQCERQLFRYWCLPPLKCAPDGTRQLAPFKV